MNTQNGIEQNIFENLLFILKSSEKESPDTAYGQLQVRSVQESQETQMAYQLKNFMDQMPGGFFIYHADGDEGIIYANEALMRIFNCDNMEEFKELTGNSFKGFVHPDDIVGVERSIREQITNNQNALDYVEYRIVQKGGGIRWVEDYGHFIHSETAGDVFYVFVGDATEKNQRIRMEKERLMQEKRLKEQQMQEKLDEYSQELKIIHQEQLRRLELIEGLSIDYESIFYVDLDKNWMKAYRVSSRLEKTFPKDGRMREFNGFDSEYIKQWVYPDDRELLDGVTSPDFIREKLAGNRTFHVNYRIFKEGKVAYIQLRIVNVGSEEHVSQIVLGYRNIDDEIIQEMKQRQVLASALNEANIANHAKNLFLSNMSHDIRTPMNAIVGFTSLIKRHLHDQEKVTGYLNMISASSDQLLQLLNDVLEISRLESEKMHIEEEECSLMEITHQVQMELLSYAADKNITLSLDFSDLKHDVVYTDQNRLMQILKYLVDNAVKYTKVDGWVNIVVKELRENEVQNSHAAYQFIVEDNGIGISEKFLRHIFEPFEREKNTTLSGIHGTGLGLTITKKIVDAMGGTIVASSVIGKGSKFTVTFSFRIQDNAPYTEDSAEIPINYATPKRILIVDDNEINLEIENEVLKDAGFLVDTAVDGSVAVEKIKKSKPGDYDLILMDIQMPIMDGYHAARAIRKIDNPALAGIPIIAVSANTFEEDKKMAMDSGMNAHLDKPLDTILLYKLIRKFLKEDKDGMEMEKMLIRPLKREEYPLLKDFLYDAIYLPAGQPVPPKNIIKQPRLAIYYEDFGQPDDFCLVAELEGEVIGAVWTRILADAVKGYGNIGKFTPEIAISVKKDFRKQGIGTKLMTEMIAIMQERRYKSISLSVNKDNYAYHMYLGLGFQVIKVQEDDYLMVLEL